jgi:Flp pilus assembly protein TadD
MEIDRELLQILMQSGYLAGGYGFFSEAETIFQGVMAARPESEYPVIGLAVSKMSAGRNDDAVKILHNQALKLNPESDLARSFIGLALKLGGLNEESLTMLKDVVAAGKDETAVKMAQSLIEEIKG